MSVFLEDISLFPCLPTRIPTPSMKVKKDKRVFPGGPVVKNPPASAEDMGSIPGPGGSPMPQGN